MYWVDPAILSKFEYLLDKEFCHGDNDCMCISGSGVSFLGCGNNLHGPLSFAGAYQCGNCQCVNNACTPIEDDPFER